MFLSFSLIPEKSPKCNIFCGILRITSNNLKIFTKPTRETFIIPILSFYFFPVHFTPIFFTFSQLCSINKILIKEIYINHGAFLFSFTKKNFFKLCQLYFKFTPSVMYRQFKTFQFQKKQQQNCKIKNPCYLYLVLVIK